MCISNGLKIANGRTLGDLKGLKTCHQPNGSSLVDYIIPDNKIINSLLYLKVEDLKPHISDHSHISYSLQLNRVPHTIENKNQNKSKRLKSKLAWNKNVSQKISEYLKSPEALSNIRKLNLKPPEDSEKFAKDFNNLLHNALDKQVTQFFKTSPSTLNCLVL